MPEQLTENQLDDLMAELMFAEDIHRGNTGAAGKYGSAVIAIADLRERLASRDAEVAELTHLLAESRARFGDSEARRAELEAALDREHLLSVILNACESGDAVWVREAKEIADAVAAQVPSVVLEDRDRENRAIGWDEGVTAAHDRLVKRVDTEGLIDQHALIKRPANPYRGDSNA